MPQDVLAKSLICSGLCVVLYIEVGCGSHFGGDAFCAEITETADMSMLQVFSSEAAVRSAVRRLVAEIAFIHLYPD